MLKEFMKKVFSAPADNTAQAVHQEEVTKMTEQQEQTTPAADNTAVTEMAAQLASQTEQLTTLQASFAELNTKYAAAEAALAASAEAQAALVAGAAAKVQATRLTKLEAVLGTEKAPVMLASLSGLDEASFETVLGGMAATYEAEAESKMFQEKGVAADAAPVAEVDAVKRLADNLAAQFKS